MIMKEKTETVFWDTLGHPGGGRTGVDIFFWGYRPMSPKLDQNPSKPFSSTKDPLGTLKPHIKIYSHFVN